MNRRDAINEILLSLNELPLDDTDVTEDIGIAVIVDAELNTANKKVLSQGWYVNTTDKSLTPDTDGYIVIPNTFLSVDTESEYIVRDWKLYDKTNNTYKFDGAVIASVIEEIIFEDVPYHLANYIVHVASLKAYKDIIGGSIEDLRDMKLALDEARTEAIRDDANKIDGNLLTGTFVTSQLDRTSL